jgi:hypothetical protein
LSPTFYLFAVAVGVLLAAFGWSLGSLRKRSRRQIDLAELEDFPRDHVTYFPQVQQALQQQDPRYLISRGAPGLAQAIQAERRKIALQYLEGVSQDFQKLLRLARVIAALSPEVAAMQEYERLRLSLQFAWRYRLICLSLKLGHSPLPLLQDLCQVVSGLSVRVDGAMSELGERAAAAIDLGSTFDGRSLDGI